MPAEVDPMQQSVDSIALGSAPDMCVRACRDESERARERAARARGARSADGHEKRKDAKRQVAFLGVSAAFDLAVDKHESSASFAAAPLSVQGGALSMADAAGGVAHSSQLSWLAQSEEEAVHDDLHQLLSETRGVVEKLADPAVKLGSWQLVLWQPRWVFAEIDGFCYQKISADESPIGKPKKIMFAAVETIEELDCAEFVLQCGKRDFTFKAPSEDACTVLVHNLRQLRERAARERAAREAQAAPAPAKKKDKKKR